MVNGQIDHMNKIWSVEKAEGFRVQNFDSKSNKNDFKIFLL